MQRISKKEVKKIQATSTTLFIEYFFDNKSLGGAYIEISGRYPEKGFAKNEISTELAYVISGNGVLGNKTEVLNFESGDSLFITTGELFYWDGNFTLYVVTTPAFDPKQHKFLD